MRPPPEKLWRIRSDQEIARGQRRGEDDIVFNLEATAAPTLPVAILSQLRRCEGETRQND
jgi:hypothetical protein